MVLLEAILIYEENKVKVILFDRSSDFVKKAFVSRWLKVFDFEQKKDGWSFWVKDFQNNNKIGKEIQFIKALEEFFENLGLSYRRKIEEWKENKLINFSEFFFSYQKQRG